MTNHTTSTDELVRQLIEAIREPASYWWASPVADVLAILLTAGITFWITRRGWQRETGALQQELAEGRRRMYYSMLWPWYRDLMEASSRLEIAAGHALGAGLPDHLKPDVQRDLRTLSGASYFLGRTSALASYALRDVIQSAGPAIRGTHTSDAAKAQAKETIREAVDRLHRCCLLSVDIKPDEYVEEISARIRRAEQVAGD